MRAGLAVSVTCHVLIVLWGVVSLRAYEPIDGSLIEIPVDFVEIADVTAMPEGQDKAPPKETPARNDPAPAPVEEPPPEPEPVVAPEPTPPPPPPPAEAPPLPEPPAPEPAAAPAPEPPAETASVPEEPPPPEPAPTPEAEPPPPEATPEPPPPAATSAAVPTPRIRPNRPKPPTPDEKSKFDTDKIAALLDKSPPAAPAAASEAPAAAGATAATPSEKLTVSELDALRAQIQSCWVIPIGWTDPAQVAVTVRFKLNQDGTVGGTPEVIEYPAGQYGQVSADNAIRAILRCGPYLLPPEKFDQWSEVQLRFIPRG
ncbi:MAG TPA: hypothetical protein PKA74_09710 [Bauldia sp.]|nr:hypothetical protein [Bauldia sp.]